MKLVLENVGALKHKLEIAPAALTIFTGQNNSGKTYAMYVLWALLNKEIAPTFAFSGELIDRLNIDGGLQIPLDEFCQIYFPLIESTIANELQQNLPTLFASSSKFFSHASIGINLDVAVFSDYYKQNAHRHAFRFGSKGTLDIRAVHDGAGTTIAVTLLDTEKVHRDLLIYALNSLLTRFTMLAYSVDAFLLPAERGGLNLFYDDLQAPAISRKNATPANDLQDLRPARHALPIERYVDFLNEAKEFADSNGPLHDQAIALQTDIAKVHYKLNKEGVITAQPAGSKQEMGIHLTSSTVKNLYGLWAWLAARAEPRDCLMIDEPELNLHPDNQRLIARLLVRLVNRGIRVVISTHSDYIVREINNMMMLATEFPERAELEREFGYAENGTERLRVEDVAAYHFTQEAVSRCEISAEFGIEVESMDEAINRLNQSNSAIYYALNEKLHPVQDAEELGED